MNLNKINTVNSKLIEQISPESIVRYYFGEFEIKKKYKSPLRNDNNPSFNWYYNSVNKLCCKDLSTGEILYPINFVMRLYNISYYEALMRIALDFNLTESCIGTSNVKLKPILEYKPKIEESFTDIRYTYRKYTTEDLRFWSQWEGSEERLKKFYIYSIKDLYINGFKVKLNKSELCFAFYNPKTDKSKIYRPFASKEDKWRSNCSGLRDILGYHQADIKNTKPKLILTKAMKEIVLYDAYDIKSISHHSENGFFIPDFIRHLKKYCESITSIYDNDNPGILGMKKINELYNIPYIIPPKEAKNITDLYVIDKEKTINFINNLKSER